MNAQLETANAYLQNCGQFEVKFEPRTESYTIHSGGLLWLSEGFSRQTAERVCAALNACSRKTIAHSIPPLGN
jgi:hypothetical protein